MRYLHTMVRISNIDESLGFYVGKLGFKEVHRQENEKGKYTNIFLMAPDDHSDEKAKSRQTPVLELTYNWEPEEYKGGRNFGHLAYAVKNIYEICQKLTDAGIVINRPPRDGHLAFIKSPDGISIELLQEGESLTPQEPWVSMQNIGTW